MRSSKLSFYCMWQRERAHPVAILYHGYFIFPRPKNSLTRPAFHFSRLFLGDPAGNTDLGCLLSWPHYYGQADTGSFARNSYWPDSSYPQVVTCTACQGCLKRCWLISAPFDDLLPKKSVPTMQFRGLLLRCKKCTQIWCQQTEVCCLLCCFTQNCLSQDRQTTPDISLDRFASGRARIYLKILSESPGVAESAGCNNSKCLVTSMWVFYSAWYTNRSFKYMYLYSENYFIFFIATVNVHLKFDVGV